MSGHRGHAVIIKRLASAVPSRWSLVLVLLLGGACTEQPASLRVQSDPSGATVRIDGREIGQTPAARTDLAPGPHHVWVSLAGRERWTADIELEAGADLTVEAVLVTLPASLRIESTPGGATVRVDGQDRGATPLALEGLPAGLFELELAARGYAPLRRELDLKPGTDTILHLSLSVDPLRGQILSGMARAETALDDGRPLAAWNLLDELPPLPPDLLDVDELQRLAHLKGRASAALPTVGFTLQFDPEAAPLDAGPGRPVGGATVAFAGGPEEFADYSITLRTTSSTSHHVCLLQFKRTAGSGVRVVPHEVTDARETMSIVADEDGARVVQQLDSTRTSPDDILYCLVVMQAAPPEGAVMDLLARAGKLEKAEEAKAWADGIVSLVRRNHWYRDARGAIQTLLVRWEGTP